LAAPTLTTNRLTLRAPRASDIDALAGHYGDPAHFDSLGGRTPDAAQARQRAAIFVVEAANFWAAVGYGPLVVMADETWVGLCGFRPPPEDVAPDDAHPLLVFGVDRALWGRGYATEAAKAVLTWAQATLRAPRLDAATRPDNAAAGAVLRKLGFDAPRPATRYGADVALFSLATGAA